MNTTDARLTARLFSACPPDNAQKAKLEDVLSKKYGKAVDLVWQEAALPAAVLLVRAALHPAAMM